MKTSIFILLILSSLTTFADERLSLKRNQWHPVDKELKFRINKIIDDSRCPKGARCVWAGRVTVEIEFHHKQKIDKLAFGPTHGIGDTINILSFPVSQKQRSKNFLEGFHWKDKTYSLMRVLPYPGEKGDEAFVFQIKNKKTSNLQNTKKPQKSEKFNLNLNQWYDVDKKLSFRVLKIIGDSRCPKGAKCSRAGEVFIQVEFQHNNQSVKRQFTINHFLHLGKEKALNFPSAKEDFQKTYKSFTWQGDVYHLYAVTPIPGEKGSKQFTWMRGNPF